MISSDFIFRQQENLVDNQKCQAGFRPLCNKILFLITYVKIKDQKPCIHKQIIVLKRMKKSVIRVVWYCFFTFARFSNGLPHRLLGGIISEDGKISRFSGCVKMAD